MLFHIAGCEMDLVFEVWEDGSGDVGGAGWVEGCTDCKDGGDQGGVVEGYTKDYYSAPIVTSEDD